MVRAENISHIYKLISECYRRLRRCTGDDMEREQKFLVGFRYQNKEEKDMDFSEKLLTLRKAKDLTQEQLAEKLNVSRQSVSKWESGQAVPELEKIVAMSVVFDVTTDYLLKSSEIDDLSVKTEMLEKQQQMLVREQRQQKIRECILYVIVIYLVLLAVYFIEKNFFWEWEWVGKEALVAEFLLATATAVFVCARKLR